MRIICSKTSRLGFSRSISTISGPMALNLRSRSRKSSTMKTLLCPASSSPSRKMAVRNGFWSTMTMRNSFSDKAAPFFFSAPHYRPGFKKMDQLSAAICSVPPLSLKNFFLAGGGLKRIIQLSLTGTKIFPTIGALAPGANCGREPRRWKLNRSGADNERISAGFPTGFWRETRPNACLTNGWAQTPCPVI